MSKLITVVGGQFGSEAKGHVTAQLARKELEMSRNPLVAVRVAGPNAGHTAHTPEGKAYALRQIPAAAVVDPRIALAIGPGSEVDMKVLLDEIELLEGDGINIMDRLAIHPEVTWLQPQHIEREQQANMRGQIGSTAKGVGAARADRLMRRAPRMIDAVEVFNDHSVVKCIGRKLYEDYVHGELTTVMIEGTQGFGLGLHAGFYPYCTSSDCRNIDFWAMAGVTPFQFHESETWVVLRTFPIRVAGNSGPLYDETTWEELGAQTNGYIKPEQTTVTKLTRRVGRWDSVLARRAVRANADETTTVALTFADYIDPKIAGVEGGPRDLAKVDTHGVVDDFIGRVESDIGTLVEMVTTGPNTAIWL